MDFLKRLFKKKATKLEYEAELSDVAPSYLDHPLGDDMEDTTIISIAREHQGPIGSIQDLRVGYATHIGQVRRRNEDSLLVLTSVTLEESNTTTFGLFVVADGMGGHSEGQQASQTAVRIVGREVASQVFVPSLRVHGEVIGETRPLLDVLSEALQSANWQIHTTNAESGTTLTVALVMGSRLHLAHVGDSRAYLLRHSEDGLPIDLLTRDHSFVQRLQDTGQISSDEAAVHPQRNILYRAIGQGEKLEIDTLSRPIPRPSWLLLCSDGLWGSLSMEKANSLVAAAANPQQACNKLLESALENGGPDNISVIIVEFPQEHD